MTTWRLTLGLIACLTLGAGLQPAVATDVCGAVCDDTWDLGGSPWVVTCDVTVAAGCTLDIDAGVEVRFQANTGLIVDGHLGVNGVDGSLVSLTSDLVTPSRGTWDSLEVRGGGSATIAYADVAWAIRGLRGVDATLSVEDSTLRESSQTGILADGGTLDVARSTLRDNGVHGIHARGAAGFAVDTVSTPRQRNVRHLRGGCLDRHRRRVDVIRSNLRSVRLPQLIGNNAGRHHRVDAHRKQLRDLATGQKPARLLQSPGHGDGFVAVREYRLRSLCERIPR